IACFRKSVWCGNSKLGRRLSLEEEIEMRTPEETYFQYYTIETLSSVRFLGFF
ncbi:unnamed protein product, partial [Porites evermanni]